ncbi:type VII secretion protein EssB [Liquorilactobacillus hordei]|uniref:Type VII secretion protein EssB n=1 Tax=Liquorilactobacillus hordei TaxID=468911 RepID=A0A3Q8CY01_9LACO|nr:type VII secretion protein EssB [Liquorilactobacillus hordei]AUJ29040.1 type VII secretion protein EssB [Liquorilactobacillus hordei]
MIQVEDISEKLEFEVTDQSVDVTLQPNQYRMEQVEQFKLYLVEKSHFLGGQVKEVSEKRLVLSYQKNSLTKNLADLPFKKMGIYERLLLTQKAGILEEYLGSPAVPFIAPENIFIQGDLLVIAHRGLMESIAPYRPTENDFFKEYRALILYMINPDLEYKNLIQGAGTLENSLSKQIQDAESFSEVNELLRDEITHQRQLREANTKLVSKKKYQFFKWGSIVLSLLTIALIILSGYLGFKKVPAQTRVITAQSEFNSKNYDAVLNALENDNPESLPRSAQYIAAVSSIKLDSLSYKQQRVLLNNVSQKSSQNTLLYWIYLGRGDFNKSLNIAQNIGDDQYILHAYTKLYDSTKSNSQMNGAKKQQLLQKYNKAINKYLKSLGGKKNDTTTSDPTN